MQTREQRYASGVYELISRTVARDESYKKSYGSMAHKLPVLVRTAGLAQALEFVATRPDSQQPQKDLLHDLAQALGYSSETALRAASRTERLETYMRLTQDALQALLWFKRYAQSVLGVQDASAEEGSA